MRIVRPLVAEALGTFMLVFVGGSAVVLNQASGGGMGIVGIAFAHGLALSVAVSLAMNISGGHINPAVSLAVFAAGKMRLSTAAMYMAAQLLAGILAALCIKWLLPVVAAETAGYGIPRVASSVTFWQAIWIEAILTMLLVSAVFGTAVSPLAPRIGGFAIGLTVTFDILAGGGLTGAAMNPARAFGPALVAGVWRAHAVYWIGPFLGALAAAALWRFILLSRETPAPATDAEA